ncbi:MAG TPA: hypothetical protein DEH25_12580 [Chloroflexi bacterium]|nr:hypothetical protein [Chloroflexota bacterium]HBY06460.1 hypothetical protein [Chloroflexota bacterium]
MMARQLARNLGFRLQDQAFISLATWELAIQLGIGVSREGFVSINPITDGKREGISIVYKFEKITESDLRVLASKEIKSLVDELEICQNVNCNGTIEISAIKWAQ